MDLQPPDRQATITQLRVTTLSRICVFFIVRRETFQEGRSYRRQPPPPPPPPPPPRLQPPPPDWLQPLNRCEPVACAELSRSAQDDELPPQEELLPDHEDCAADDWLCQEGWLAGDSLWAVDLFAAVWPWL